MIQCRCFILISGLLNWSWSYVLWNYNYQWNQYLSQLTNIVTSNPAHGEVYSIQLYAIKFVSDLWQVGGFLLVLRFPLSIKLSEIFLKVALNTITIALLNWQISIWIETRVYDEMYNPPKGASFCCAIWIKYIQNIRHFVFGTDIITGYIRWAGTASLIYPVIKSVPKTKCLIFCLSGIYN